MGSSERPCNSCEYMRGILWHARPLARSPARPLRAPWALCRRTRDNGSRPRPSERATFGAGTRKAGATHRPDPLPWTSIIDIQWLTSSNIPPPWRKPWRKPLRNLYHNPRRLDQI